MQGSLLPHPNHFYLIVSDLHVVPDPGLLAVAGKWCHLSAYHSHTYTHRKILLSHSGKYTQHSAHMVFLSCSLLALVQEQLDDNQRHHHQQTHQGRYRWLLLLGQNP